jgi:hypothetical protein
MKLLPNRVAGRVYRTFDLSRKMLSWQPMLTTRGIRDLLLLVG